MVHALTIYFVVEVFSLAVLRYVQKDKHQVNRSAAGVVVQISRCIIIPRGCIIFRQHHIDLDSYKRTLPQGLTLKHRNYGANKHVVNISLTAGFSVLL